jgi:hypothetical protein
MRARSWTAAALFSVALGACYVYPEERWRDSDYDDDYGYSYERDAGGISRPDSGSTDAAPARTELCAGGKIDPYKELLIFHPTVIGDTRTTGAMAPWSFGGVMERIAPGQASGVTLAWLESWMTDAQVSVADGVTTSAPARPTIESQIVCPWLKLSSSNMCDTTCGYCKERKLDMAKAPFKLIAIVNRVDLHENDGACAGTGAEGRLVFTAMKPGTSTPLEFTVIFEYRAPASTDGELRAWAREWHALGDLPHGGAYNSKLQSLTDRFSKTGQLAQVRTNEVALGKPMGKPWEMREFHFVNGQLALAPLTQTPHHTLNATMDLASFIAGHRSSIVGEGDNALSPSMQSAYALVPTKSFVWTAPGLNDEPALTAFNKNTCNGCHGGAGQPNAITFQHIAPPQAGYYTGGGGTQVSGFTVNDLSRRAAIMKKLVCESCDVPEPSYWGAPGTEPRAFRRTH